MIRINTVLNRDNINKIRFIKNGSPMYLNTITEMRLWIPELNITIVDNTPNAYPLKWEHDVEDVGLLELQLGMQDNLIDNYIITTTGDIASGSEIIENIPTNILNILERRMFIYGTGLGSSAQIYSVKKSSGTIYLTTASTSTSTGVELKIHKEVENNIHTGKIYIYNAEYPDGLYWLDLEVKVDIGV